MMDSIAGRWVGGHVALNANVLLRTVALSLLGDSTTTMWVDSISFLLVINKLIFNYHHQ
jgi:hypothetical protein